ncbi:hypothetical protein NUM3379_10450 [Kineococcus sp. NUM-3379]
MTDTSTTDLDSTLPASDEAGALTVHRPQKETFADHGVLPEIAEALAGAGIVKPFPIQAMTLPVALSGHDIIGQAKTGTGKTLGFGVPLLQRTAVPGEAAYEALPAPGKPQALVIVPTRELAVQVAHDLTTASRIRKTRILTVYGGRAYEPQIEALRKGVDAVVGTPGRLLDLAQQKHLDLSRVRCVVLDEADEMLDLGFLPDVEKLLAQTSPARQTMLFSATMPGAVVSLARAYMTHPTHIRAVDPTDDGATVAAITQFVFRAHAMDKIEVLARLLQAEGRGLTIVFSRTKRTAANVAEQLQERGFAAASLHGDLGQGAREQALRAFRNGKVDVLVATDVAARGIDVEDVTHVVNYQCPEDEKTYLHRTGRTGRAGNTGVAVTFVDWDDMHRWAQIDRALDLGFGEPVETYSTSPHLFEDLGIPAGTTGRLPRTQRTRAGLGAEEVEDLGEVGRGARPKGRGAGQGRGSDQGRGGGQSRGAGETRSSGEGRSAGEGRRGAPAEEVPTTGPAQEEGAPARQRNRTRRRTRNGQPVEDGPDASAPQASAPDASAPQAPAPQASAPQAPDREPAGDAAEGAGPAEGGQPRRRRSRTRRGADASDGAGSTDAPAGAPAADQG